MVKNPELRKRLCAEVAETEAKNSFSRFVDTARAVNVTAKVCDKWDELALSLYVESERHKKKDGYLDSETDFH